MPSTWIFFMIYLSLIRGMVDLFRGFDMAG
jgi:hypothetical protein